MPLINLFNIGLIQFGCLILTRVFYNVQYYFHDVLLIFSANFSFGFLNTVE